MDYDMIEQKVKDFVLEALKDARKAKNNPHISVLNCRGIAFGALEFAINNLFPAYNQDLADWWKNEIYDEFTKLL